MLNRRKKAVTVEFSPDEYAALLAVCEARGTNISDLIRSSLQAVVSSDPIARNDARGLLDSVQRLTKEVEELRRLLDRREERHN